LDMEVEVTTTDILCSGEFGKVDVQVSGGVPGFFTYRLYKNGILVDSFGPNATANYTFDEMGQGTYTLSVETGKCEVVVTEDVNGNPITIGGGILPIGVTATAENSFGCGATSVDVNLTTFGGTGPY